MTTETKIALGIAALAIVYGAYRYNTLSKAQTVAGIAEAELRAQVLKNADPGSVQRAAEGDMGAAADLGRQLESARLYAASQEKV